MAGGESCNIRHQKIKVSNISSNDWRRDSCVIHGIDDCAAAAKLDPAGCPVPSRRHFGKAPELPNRNLAFIIESTAHGAGSIDEIRKLARLLTETGTTELVAASSTGKRAAPKQKKQKKTFKVKLEKPEDDPILSATTHAEMEAMVPVYKILYQLENSIRQFISRVLAANHGSDWWDTLAPRGLKDTVAKRMREEESKAWHQRRSAKPIDYIDLNQLPALVRAAQADFVPAFFESTEWFQHFIDEVYASRCVVCHMNPLNQTFVDSVGIAFNKWETLAKHKVNSVESLEKPAKEKAELAPQIL